MKELTSRELEAAKKALEEVGLEPTTENLEKVEIKDGSKGIKGNKYAWIYIPYKEENGIIIQSMNFSSIDVNTLKSNFED